MNATRSNQPDDSVFQRAESYDLSINWEARLGREVPVLTEFFGPPNSGGILDAGCGTGRQAVALAKLGYRVTGLDANSAMLELARTHARDTGVGVSWVTGPYGDISQAVAAGFDGICCLANALAAAATRAACAEAIGAFAGVLRPGGKLFVQILNFRRMRDEHPCVRGPRIAQRDGREYVSVRHFTFAQEHCSVTNITLWNDGAWRQEAHCGTLYPIDVDEIVQWCDDARLRVDGLWGSYARQSFDVVRSTDLILMATRLPEEPAPP